MAFETLRSSVSKLFGATEQKSASTTYDDWGLGAFLTPNTVAGPAVTPTTAMRVPAVNAAVSLIASSLGTLPAKLYQRVDGSKEVAFDHPAHRLVHRSANEWTSAGRLREILTTDALLFGDGYAVANRVNGRVVEFNRVAPTAMSIETDDFGAPTYVLSLTSGKRRFGFRDVLHLPALVTFDGISGEAPIALCREAIGLALIMEEHGSRLFKNGARPSSVIEYPGDATKAGGNIDGATVRKNLVAAARLGMEGADNSGKLGIVFDGGKFTPYGFSSTDAQFLELRRFAIDEIARAFRVPPHMLFEMGRATWGNSEEMGRQFLQLTLLPWLRAWEAAYSRVLLTEDEADELSIDFVVDDLLRADTAARFEAYSKAIASRILNPNEVRALENRAPYDGGDLFINPNTTTGTAPAKEAA